MNKQTVLNEISLIRDSLNRIEENLAETEPVEVVEPDKSDRQWGQPELLVADQRVHYSRHLALMGGSVLLKNNRLLSGGGIERLPFVSHDYRPAWTRSDRVYGFLSETEFGHWEDSKTSVLIEMDRHGADGSQLGLGASEGNLSIDDRYVVLTQGGSAGNVNTMWSVDLQTGRVLGMLTLAEVKNVVREQHSTGARKFSDINWVGYCRSGKYIVVGMTHWGYIRYNADFSEPVIIGAKRNGSILRVDSQHSDFFVGLDGSDCFVSRHWSGCVWFDLAEPERIYREPDWGGDGHYSGTAIERPGFVVHTSEEGNISGLVFDKRNYGSRETEQDADYISIQILPEQERHPEQIGQSDAGFEKTLASSNKSGDAVVFNRATGVSRALVKKRP